MGAAAPQLAILVPVKGRPHRVRPVLESIQRTCSARVYFVADPDDQPEIEAIRESEGWFPEQRLLRLAGNYAAKINLAVRCSFEPFLLFGADDVEFHDEWFEAAMAAMQPGVGVVSTRDLCQRKNDWGELATHPVVARWYAEADTFDGSRGPLYEGYPHEYSDREFSEVARKRGVFVFAPESIVEHLHPLVDKAPVDHLYAGIRSRLAEGKPIYRERRRKWLKQLS